MIQGQGPVASPPWATSGVPVSQGTTTPATRVHHGPSRAERPAGPAIGLSPSGLLRAPHLRLLWGAPNGTKQDRRSPE